MFPSVLRVSLWKGFSPSNTVIAAGSFSSMISHDMFLTGALSNLFLMPCCFE